MKQLYEKVKYSRQSCITDELEKVSKVRYSIVALTAAVVILAAAVVSLAAAVVALTPAAVTLTAAVVALTAAVVALTAAVVALTAAVVALTAAVAAPTAAVEFVGMITLCLKINVYCGTEYKNRTQCLEYRHLIKYRLSCEHSDMTHQ